MKGECRFQGQWQGRGGRSQDKQGLEGHFKFLGPCSTNYVKPLKSIEQNSDTITVLKKDVGSFGNRLGVGARDDTGRPKEAKVAG